MTEERLKEIKNSIDFQMAVIPHSEQDIFIQEELELYNEVIRLREIIDELNNFVRDNEVSITYYMRGFGIENRKRDLLNILDKAKLTLENLSGIENQ